MIKPQGVAQELFSRKHTNIQKPETCFVGRDEVLTSLSHYFESRKLITLLGPPGVGKTRLAIEFALHSLSKQFEEAWFCDLSKADTLDDFLYAIGYTLQLSLHAKGGANELISQIGSALSYRKETLLILDNFEHLVEHAPETIAVWCKVSPDTRLLVTSRERLRLQEEYIFDLSPLEVPKESQNPSQFSSVELFLERARMVRQDYQPTEKELEAIGVLVRQLDGLPLAIELAAARIRLLSPAQILEKLQKRFQLLNTAATDGQSTLFETIGYSWDLLEPYEQSALAQCAVFRGGFRLEDAEQVIDLTSYENAPWIIDVLQSLCDKSLLKSEEVASLEGERRFSLYLSIRDYAWQKISKEEQKEIFSRYVAHFLAEGARWRNILSQTGQTKVRHRLGLATENFLSIYRQLIQITPYTKETARQITTIPLILMVSLERRGPYNQLLSILSSAIDVAKNILCNSKAHINLLLARGLVYRALGEFTQHQADYQTAYIIYQKEKLDLKNEENSLMLSRIFHGFMFDAYFHGKPEEAREYGKKALKVLEKQKRDRRKAIIYTNLSVLEKDWGEIKKAIQHIEKALAIFQQIGDRLAEGVVLGNLGNFALEQGLLEKAEPLLLQSLQLSQETNDQEGEIVTLIYLGLLRQVQKNLPGAFQYVKNALQLSKMIGHERAEGSILEILAICSLEMDDFSDSRQYFTRSLMIYQKAKYHIYEARLRSFFGVLESIEGNLEAAKQQFAKAQKQLLNRGNPTHIAIHTICSTHLELAYAKQAALLGDFEEEKAYRETASKKIDTVFTTQIKEESKHTVIIRFALRLFEKFQTHSIFTPTEMTHTQRNKTKITVPANNLSHAALIVHEGGKWFRLPAGEFVDLAGRNSMNLLIQAMAKTRRKHPGQVLSWKELLSIGWPGEKVRAESGKNRVYATLSMLRNLGLREIIKTKRGGYFLDPEIPVIFTHDEMK